MSSGVVPSDDRPSADHLATARRLRELHRPSPDPTETICWWCLKLWPCPDEQWATRTLHRGSTPN